MDAFVPLLLHLQVKEILAASEKDVLNVFHYVYRSSAIQTFPKLEQYDVRCRPKLQPPNMHLPFFYCLELCSFEFFIKRFIAIFWPYIWLGLLVSSLRNLSQRIINLGRLDAGLAVLLSNGRHTAVLAVITLI